MRKLVGKIKKGYGVASGCAENSPYPKGSIELQVPYFRKLGLDISHCVLGTLNISIKPYGFKMIQPEYTFEMVNWYEDLCETFSFSRCRVIYNGKEVDGFIYYPHPETKPDHFHDDSLIEVLAAYLGEIAEGEEVELLVDEKEIQVGDDMGRFLHSQE